MRQTTILGHFIIDTLLLYLVQFQIAICCIVMQSSNDNTNNQSSHGIKDASPGFFVYHRGWNQIFAWSCGKIASTWCLFAVLYCKSVNKLLKMLVSAMCKWTHIPFQWFGCDDSCHCDCAFVLERHSPFKCKKSLVGKRLPQKTSTTLRL